MDKVEPGWNNKQGWGKLPKLAFPPLLDNPPRAQPSGINASTDIIVCCVCTGPKFPKHYVFRLQAMVKKHLSFDHTFACITERKSDFGFIGSGIHVIPPERPEFNGSWYSKINLFSPHTFPHGTRVLFFDLDVVIIDSIDDLVLCEEPFIMIREFNAKPEAAHNASIMSWVPPYPADCFAMPSDWTERSWGDQECIWTIMGNERIWDWPDPWVKSWKYHGRANNLGDDCRVVIFHGDPKPDAVHSQLVEEHWTNIIKET